ncbi:hypothetical protein HGRIS_004953 [Hohenbuehelia grisea]|uniref:Protein kinase domain-containing protein n=1 Tax=Hohenbuehelia grisea TaxID=104357 RepID=A0ABR3JDH4_9AGAR
MVTVSPCHSSAALTYPHRNFKDLTDRLLPELTRTGKTGAQTVLHLAKLETKDGKQQQVAVRVFASRPVNFQEAARKLLEAEFPRWSLVDHPNLAPLLGVIRGPSNIPLSVVPYYPRGSLWDHLPSNPISELSRDQIAERLLWTLEIARAIEYLHSFDPPIIHSDLRCANIFLDEENHVRVAEYAFVMTMPSYVPQHVWAAQSPGHSPYRWMAPEFLRTKRPPHRLDPPLGYTTASDVWAFGMTVLEVRNDLASEKSFVIHIRSLLRAPLMNKISPMLRVHIRKLS